MPNSIEIFENTLLKLLVRQGTDSDRLAVIFSSGELAYTTDTKRLYVGDGSTVGGNLVGNVFKGSNADITTLAPGVIGDLAFDNDNNKLYRLETSDGSNISHWELIGGVYTAGDNSIVISSDNKFSMGLLSSQHLDPSIVNSPIYLDGSNVISLSSTIVVDSIQPKNTTSVTLFSALSVNGINYKFPPTKTVGGFLQVLDSSGNIGWSSVSLSSISTNTVTVNHPLTSTANGIASTGTAVNPLTANIQIGVSPTLSSYSLWARYNSSLNGIIANKGISSVVRTGKGKYTFTYDNPLSTPYPCILAQIYGSDGGHYHARVVEADDISCKIEITWVNNSLLFLDADLSLRVET